MPNDFKFHAGDASGHTVIPMTGRFTFSDYAAFRKAIDTALAAKPNRVTLDMAGLEFIDSAALGMLLLAKDEAEKINAVVDIKNAGGQVIRVLEVARFKQLFAFH